MYRAWTILAHGVHVFLCWISLVFFDIIFVAIMLVSEIIVMILGVALFSDFSKFESDKLGYVYTIVTSKLIYFIIMMAILKLSIRKKESESGNKYYWLLFVMPLASTIALLSFRYMAYYAELTPQMTFWWMLSAVLLLFANIIVFVIYEYSSRNTKELYELKALARQEEYDRKYYDVVEQSNNEMRVFAHDMKNHLFALSQMSDSPEVKSYIEKISGEIQKAGKGCESGNHTLDIILNKYVAECERKGISFEYDVSLANFGFVEDYDLVTILGNLLDNALEAAEQSVAKKITLSTAKVNTYDSLTVKNSCDTPPDKNLKTTKKNKQLHGLGIKSIQKAVKKYDGELEWEYDENEKQFSITVILLSKD